MFNGINLEDLPPELQQKMDAVEADMKSVVDKGVGVLSEIETFFRNKVQSDDGLADYELDNAFQPIVNLSSGYRPAVVPFEIRGGEHDGKRLITLCVILADEKTVMPVLQVPDFAVIEQAEYVGSMEEIEVILPEDLEGRDWQKTVAETVKEYISIYGGNDE